MLDTTIRDDAATLGVVPSASAAGASKQLLAASTLASARALCEGLVAERFAARDELERAFHAIERLEALLPRTARPAEAVEPAFYEWYFRGIDLLKRGQFTALARHARKASAVAAVPLMRSGALDEHGGRPLEVDLIEDDRLILSEREWPDGEAPIVGPVAELATRGSTLHVRTPGRRAIELDWQRLDSYGRYPLPGCPLSFQQTGHASRRVVADYQRDLARIHEDVQPFRLVPPEEFEAARLQATFVGRFHSGLDLIQRCWPELYDETCVLTDQFTLIHGVPFIGGSAISCMGISFFKLLPEWSDVCFADHIVHEAAHQRLHVEFELEAALANGDFTAVISPIRRDPRPLYGVLHATFVFLRLSLFLERVLEREPSLEAEQRFHRHVLGLYRGLEALERYAEWNPRGEQLYGFMREAADRLRTVLPVPDPDHYNQLGPDYEPVSALAAAYHD